MTWDVSGLSYDSKLFTPVESGTLDLQGFALRPDGSTLYILNEAGSWPHLWASDPVHPQSAHRSEVPREGDSDRIE